MHLRARDGRIATEKVARNASYGLGRRCRDVSHQTLHVVGVDWVLVSFKISVVVLLVDACCVSMK